VQGKGDFAENFVKSGAGNVGGDLLGTAFKKGGSVVVNKLKGSTDEAAEAASKQATEKAAKEAEKKSANAVKKKVTGDATSSVGQLKFGENDLIYGPSAGGQLRKLQEKAGGKLLNDLEKPIEKNIVQFSLETLDQAAASGRKVHFDLTHVKELEDVLLKKGKFADSVTAQELRHITQNWEKFKNIVTFYREGKVVKLP
jgi:hypothetical protein